MRVATQVNETLALIAETTKDARLRYNQFFTEELPRLTLISSLAEGADRIAAAEALKNGYLLAAVLPFDREEYERDFKQPSSRCEYTRLLEQAATTLVLPGHRTQETVAYRTAGLTIVQNVDVLLTVWDGRPCRMERDDRVPRACGPV